MTTHGAFDQSADPGTEPRLEPPLWWPAPEAVTTSARSVAPPPVLPADGRPAAPDDPGPYFAGAAGDGNPPAHEMPVPVVTFTKPDPVAGEPPWTDDPFPGDSAFDWGFENQDPGQFAWENPKPTGLRKWWLPVAAGVLAVLALTLTIAYILVGSEGTPAAQPTAPTVGPPASVIDPARLAQYQPRRVSTAAFEGRLQVTWEPPENATDVAGYVVAAQTLSGDLLDSELIQTGDLLVVFSGPSANPGTCVVVTTLVRSDQGIALAKGDPVCPDNATTTPGAASDGPPAPNPPAAPPPGPTP